MSDKISKRPAKPKGKAQGGNDKTPLLEWVFALCGFVMVLMMFGFIGYSAAQDDHSPPEIIIRVIEVVPSGSGYLVLFRADNNGGSTAADLTIRGSLKEGDRGEERASSTVMFDYLPAHSFRTGGLFFAEDPSRYTVELRPMGYQDP